MSRDQERGRCALLALAVVCVLLLAVACGDAEPTPGPLAPVEPLAGQAGGFRVPEARIGHPFTFAEVFVTNSGSKPATLVGIELMEPTEGISLVGSEVAIRQGDGPYSPGGYERFPPETDFPTDSLKGFQLPPSDGTSGLQLLIGLMIEPGVQTFRGVAIEYMVDGVEHRYVFPYAVAACSRGESGGPGGSCRPPGLQPWGF